jgi:hypothetical protein
MISPRNFRARSKTRELFPEAVGPRITTNFGLFIFTAENAEDVEKNNQ